MSRPSPLNLLANITMAEMKKKPEIGCVCDHDGRASGCSDYSIGGGLIYHFIGLFIVAGLPTAFWLGCFFLAGSYFEMHLDLFMFCLAGVCVFLFLSMVYGLFASGERR